MHNMNARIEIHPGRGVPSRIYDIEMEAGTEMQEIIAELFLKKIAILIQIKPDLSQLKFDQVKKSLTGYHVLYQQYYYGKPISGAWVRVDIDNDGKVFNIMNNLLPEWRLNTGDAFDVPKISAGEAEKFVRDGIRSSKKAVFDFVKTELVYFIHEESPVLAWKFLLKLNHPPGEWKIYVDAKSGENLAKIDLRRYVSGQGRVFNPNPVATLEDFTLRDGSTIPDEAYFEVELPELEDTGKLDGPYVSTRLTADRVERADFKFLFKRGEKKRFKEVMAYYHIDSVQRYIQELGYNNIMNKQIAVNVDGSPVENSFYSSIDKSITYGNKGVDDAEDAEMIVHEYGHAILDDVVPGFGEGNDHTNAMGEGFGDYLAASFFADKKPDILKATFGNWNAAALNGGNNPPFTRRLNEPKKFRADFISNAHKDGEIWSACLWSIRVALGRETADKLIFEHLHFLTRESKFVTAAKAIIQADEKLNNGVNATIIRDIFIAREILLKPN
ncbi:MAG: M36 family metallopeptidase [Ferruginibacter sp.]